MRWAVFLSYAATLIKAYTTYSDDHIRSFTKGLPHLSLLDIHDGSLLTPLLVPRVSGTQGATDVLNWMSGYLQHNLTGWKVEEDRFTAKTPLAEVEFVNLIATMDPPGFVDGEVQRLVLAAHYDSKMSPPGFIGATDSSVPCAILLYLASMLSERLPLFWEEQYWTSLETLEERTPRGIQLIFFDGEEAVLDWTDTDSIYGARHLAARWDTEHYSPSPTYARRRSKLDSIDLFVLLDLLGAPTTKISSFFSTTHWAYEHLAWIEEVLRKTHLTQTVQSEHIFAGYRHQFEYAGKIGDDHVPFMDRGVEVLHIIPIPFPEVWHTAEDDGAHLDQSSINDLALIFSAFAAQYMELPALHSLKSDSAGTSKRDIAEL